MGNQERHLQLLKSPYKGGHLLYYSSSPCCGDELRFITQKGNAGRAPRCQKCGKYAAENYTAAVYFPPSELKHRLTELLGEYFGVTIVTATLWALQIAEWLEGEGPLRDLARWPRDIKKPFPERRGLWGL